MNRTHAAFVLAAGIALACGVIELAQPPAPLVNTCTDNTTCQGDTGDASVDVTTALCSGGSCITSNNAFVPILIVTAPLSAALIGGNTFGIPDQRKQELAQQPGNACVAGCVFLPPLANGTNGYLDVSPGFGTALWPPGLRPNQDNSNPPTTTLPVSVTFHPFWLDPATQQPVLATKLGLPLDDVFGSEMTQFGHAAPTTSDASVPPGFVFSGNVPQPYAPADKTGLFPDPSQYYEVEIVPNDPFVVFPPLVGQLQIPMTQPTLTSVLFDLHQSVNLPANKSIQNVFFYDQPILPTKTPIRSHPYQVQASAGAPSLAGWRVYVVDGDGRRVSGLITLSGAANEDITVYEATGNAAQPGETLFIDPPSGVDLPRYEAPAVGSGSSAAIPGPFLYPALPAPVTVSGFVRRFDNAAATTARIVFVADGTTSFVIGTDSSNLTSLSYVKVVTTDPTGFYETPLPPGTFRAYVIPDAGDLALTVDDARKVLLNPPNGQEGGQTLQVNSRTHVMGRVVLGNGTPIYAADVVIGATADAPVALPRDDILARPRQAFGTTDINGFFDVMSDPGVTDISIRPQDGTRFPWEVLTNRFVPPTVAADGGAASMLALPPIVIPLPVPYPGRLAGVLTDSVGNALTQTVIRAYAFPTLITPPDGGPPQSQGARQIGVTTTDASGAFQLFVAPLDP